MCLAKLAKKYEKYSLLPIRLALGLTFVIAGYGKVFGGVDGFAGMLSGTFGSLAIVIAWSVALIELVGGIAVIAGVATRVFSALLGIIMIAAIGLVHLGQGWAGMSYQVTLLLIALTLTITGAGKVLNNDKKLFGKEC